MTPSGPCRKDTIRPRILVPKNVRVRVNLVREFWSVWKDYLKKVDYFFIFIIMMTGVWILWQDELINQYQST